MSLLDMVSRFGRPIAAGQGDHLFWQGDKSGDFFVVQSGLLKGYYVSDEGQERIKSFILPGEVIGSLTALTGKGTCSFNLVCLEPTEMIAVSFEEVSTAAQTDAALGTAITDFLVAFGMKKEQREYELLCLSAEERYRRLASSRPKLLELVNQSDIALYLGVTPVGLSRIKKRVEQSVE